MRFALARVPPAGLLRRGRRGSGVVALALLAACSASSASLQAPLPLPQPAPNAPATTTASATTTATTTATVLEPAPDPSGEVRLLSSGLERAYTLHVPSTGTGARPLVVALHGRYQTRAKIAAYTGFAGVADRRGFVVAFPGAVGGGWNAGTCCSTGAARQIDDVGFLDDVIRDVAGRTSVDLRRVYVVGFSNGGMLAYRYGCQRSGRVAGVAVVAGAMTADASFARPAPPACRPTEPVALLHVHGTADALLPAGGVQRGLGTDATSAATSVAAFVSAAGCTRSSLQRVGHAEKRTYGGCRTTDGRGVRYVSIRGLGHQWTRTGRGYDTTTGIVDALFASSSPRAAGR